MTRCVDELLFHWPSVVRHAEKGWPQDFARSIQTQARRRNWRPSPKQHELMHSMVIDLFMNPSTEEGFDVIESD